MRVLLFLGALLFASPVFAFNDSVVSYCASTQRPQHCISSHLTFEKYYSEDYGKFLLAVESDPLARSSKSDPPASPTELIWNFCASPLKLGTAEHCQDTFLEMAPYFVGFVKWHNGQKGQTEQRAIQQQQLEAQQRQIDAQLAMQQQMIDAQLEQQARIQANGMALFGAGNALINGMNQNLNNMRLPMPPSRR
jgi:hypothetical protein